MAAAARKRPRFPANRASGPTSRCPAGRQGPLTWPPARCILVLSEPYEWAKAHFFIGVKQNVLSHVTEIAERVGASEGIEIVEVELLGGGKHRTLRIFIDKPGGVSHADCENISNQVGTILDVEDAIPGGSYNLEVSSPGIERKLKRPQDFERFTGQKAKIVLKAPIENQKVYIGTLKSYAGDTIHLEPERGGEVLIPFDQVDRANLKYDW